MDTPYSNRELNAMFKTLTDKMDEQHDDAMRELVEIKAQTTKTNGRVSALERKEESAKAKMNTAIAIILTLVIPLVVYVFFQSTKCADGSCVVIKTVTSQ